MAENANESWWKPTNILLCLLLFASSVQKAVPMNSEKFHPRTPSEKKKTSSSSCSKHRPGINAGLTICMQFSETCIKQTPHKALDLDWTLPSATLGLCEQVFGP